MVCSQDNFYFYATDDSNKTGEDGISNLEFGETIRPDDIDKAGFSFQKYKASKKWHQITVSALEFILNGNSLIKIFLFEAFSYWKLHEKSVD